MLMPILKLILIHITWQHTARRSSRKASIHWDMEPEMHWTIIDTTRNSFSNSSTIVL